MIASAGAGSQAALALTLLWLAGSSPAIAQEAILPSEPAVRDESAGAARLTAPGVDGGPPRPDAQVREVRFRFESEPPDLALDLITGHGFRRHGTLARGAGPATGTGVLRVHRSAYRTLCTSPCAGTLAPGLHTFGLTHPNGEVWVALPPLALSLGQLTSIRGTLVDHSGDRLGGGLFLVLGGLTGLGGAVGSLAVMLSSGDALGTPDGDAVFGVMIGSGLLFLLAMAVGLPLVFSVDRAWVVGLAPQ